MRKLAPKILIIAVVVVGLVAVWAPRRALAHFPATQGSLTAILHVEPDDTPTPGKPETIYFIFSDLANKFKVVDCSCNLSISEHGQQLYYASLVPPPTRQLTIYDTAGIPFSFPQQDNYRISLTGRPIAGDQFKAFSLIWNFNVSQPPSHGHSFAASTFLIIFGGLLVVLLLLGVIVFALG